MYGGGGRAAGEQRGGACGGGTGGRSSYMISAPSPPMRLSVNPWPLPLGSINGSVGRGARSRTTAGPG